MEVAIAVGTHTTRKKKEHNQSEKKQSRRPQSRDAHETERLKDRKTDGHQRRTSSPERKGDTEYNHSRSRRRNEAHKDHSHRTNKELGQLQRSSRNSNFALVATRCRSKINKSSQSVVALSEEELIAEFSYSPQSEAERQVLDSPVPPMGGSRMDNMRTILLGK